MIPEREALAPLEVAILVLPESAPMAAYGLHEVLMSVGKTWRQLTGEYIAVRQIRPRIVARGKEPFVSVTGTQIAPQAPIDDNDIVDVVIVVDIELPLSPASRWQEEIAWICRQFAAGATVCSTCTGSVVLAEAGLLDDRDAASHWSAAQLFRERYTKVRFHPDRIICDSAIDGRLLTTGGASSWQDLALYLIGRFCGVAEAVRTAKIFLIGDRSYGQLPFAAMTRARQHDDAVVSECQAWIADHYADVNPVTRMAAMSGLPERTFKRRFRQSTGYTPIDYVQALRIEEAKQMLETTPDRIDTIAAAVGYEDVAFFRRLFKRRTGITAAQYRQRYQTIR